MIFEYDNSGRIFHVVQDPVPTDLTSQWEAMGKQFIEIPPVPQPEIEMVDGEGNTVMQSPGTTTFEVDLFTDWFNGTEVVKRPGVDWPSALTLSVGSEHPLTAPDPCKILVDGQEFVITGGELTLDARMPADYRIVVDQWPYLPHTLEVTVDAS